MPSNYKRNNLKRSIQMEPTAEELARYNMLRGYDIEPEEDDDQMRSVTAAAPTDCPPELREIPFPIFLPDYTTVQNHVLNKLLRNCDKTGYIMVDPHSMSFEITTPSQFRTIVGVLCDRRVLIPLRKNKNEYRIQAATLRDLYLASKATVPQLPEIAPETPAPVIVHIQNPIHIQAPAVLAATDPKLKECFVLWEERFKSLAWDEAECIQEHYNAINARGFDGYVWIMEAIRMLSKKTDDRTIERTRSKYFTGIVRNWMIYGFGWIPTQEYDELRATFEETFDVKLSDRGNRFLGRLMHQYGVLKVMKVLLIRQDKIDTEQDPSILLLELLAHEIGDYTGQAPMFTKEDIA